MIGVQENCRQHHGKPSVLRDIAVVEQTFNGYFLFLGRNYLPFIAVVVGFEQHLRRRNPFFVFAERNGFRENIDVTAGNIQSCQLIGNRTVSGIVVAVEKQHILCNRI